MAPGRPLDETGARQTKVRGGAGRPAEARISRSGTGQAEAAAARPVAAGPRSPIFSRLRGTTPCRRWSRRCSSATPTRRPRRPRRPGATTTSGGRRDVDADSADRRHDHLGRRRGNDDDDRAADRRRWHVPDADPDADPSARAPAGAHRADAGGDQRRPRLRPGQRGRAALADRGDVRRGPRPPRPATVLRIWQSVRYRLPFRRVEYDTLGPLPTSAARTCPTRCSARGRATATSATTSTRSAVDVQRPRDVRLPDRPRRDPGQVPSASVPDSESRRRPTRGSATSGRPGTTTVPSTAPTRRRRRRSTSSPPRAAAATVSR